MKKIVGIIAAVAMAASVFAVDFSAGARVEGDLFSYNGTSKTLSALTLTQKNEDYHKPFNFSISGDRAGATVKINTNARATTKNSTYNIWFKPFDAVKVEFGSVALAMHTETMGWYRRILNYDTWGYKAAATFGDATVTLGLIPAADGAWVFHYQAERRQTVSRMYIYRLRFLTNAGHCQKHPYSISNQTHRKQKYDFPTIIAKTNSIF